MKNLFGMKSLSYATVAFVMFLASCSDNNKIDFTTTMRQMGGWINFWFFLNGCHGCFNWCRGRDNRRTNGWSRVRDHRFGDNDRLKCATVKIEKSANSTKENPAGVITITFPADGSCKDIRALARTGTITITYTGRKFFSGIKDYHNVH